MRTDADIVRGRSCEKLKDKHPNFGKVYTSGAARRESMLGGLVQDTGQGYAELVIPRCLQ